MNRIFRFTAPLIFPFIAIAEPEQDDLLNFEEGLLEELPIVLSASRLAQPLNESPVAMTVIDREMIDASGARTIPDLLRLVPGFQVGYFDGNTPVATYHGHGDEDSRRVQVLIDGRSVYVPSLAAIKWSDLIITIEEIERIEVIRGPNAATYGNNSFLAVISIITRHAIEDQGHKIKVTAGSKETLETIYRFGGNSESMDYRVTVGGQTNDGTDLLNDYTHGSYLSYRLDNQLDLQNSLYYQGGLKDNRLGDHESPPDHQRESSSAFQWLKWEHQSDSRDSLSLQYYYNYHNEDLTNENLVVQFSQAPTVDPFTPEPTVVKSERHDIEFNYTFNFEKLRLVVGSSARVDIVSAKNVFKTDDTLEHKLYRLFSHGEYRFNNDWLINAGFVVEDNDISGNDLSPRLALIYHANKNNSFRLSGSRATRTPTLYDQNAYQVLNQQLTENGGNPLSPFLQGFLGGTDIINAVSLVSPFDIDSEEIKSIEFGYITKLLNNKLLIDIKLFKDKTDNLIDRTNDRQPFAEDNVSPAIDPINGGVSHFVLNGAKSNSEGLEISFDYKPKKDLRIYGFCAYIDIEGFRKTPLSNDATPDRLAVSAPTNSYGLQLISHWDNNFTFSLMYYRASTFDWLDRTRQRDPQFWLDRNVHQYDKVDIKFDKLYKLKNDELRISLTLQNLADKFYDYNRTEYAGPSLSNIHALDAGDEIRPEGSLQDSRAYLEVSFMFN